jgi:hypothetical protein
MPVQMASAASLCRRTLFTMAEIAGFDSITYILIFLKISGDKDNAIN